MATRDVSLNYANDAIRGAVLAQWSGLLNGDDGGVITGAFRYASVQFQGAFGSGGSVQLEASNDGANWHLVADPQGNDIVKTAADLETAMDCAARYLRPRVTAGDGATNLVVTLFGLR